MQRDLQPGRGIYISTSHISDLVDRLDGDASRHVVRESEVVELCERANGYTVAASCETTGPAGQPGRSTRVNACATVQLNPATTSYNQVQ